MKRVMFGIVLPVVLLTTGVGAFIALGKAEPKKLPPPGTDVASRLALLPAAEAARVALLSDHADTLDIRVSGTVVPFRQINIAAEVDGRVVYKAAEARAGNLVQKGQLLYRIDPRDYQLAADRLERMLEQEQVAIKELEQEVENTQRMVDITSQELALHDADMRRLQALREGVASQAELDQLRRQRLVAVNQATNLQNQMHTLNTRRLRLELAERLARNQLEQARLNLERCEIVAPVDGMVAADMAEADSYMRKGETLATLEDLESVEVQCNLRVDQLMWVLDQQEARSAGELPPATPANAYALPRTPVTIEFKVSGREDLLYRWQGHLDRYDGSGLDPQSRTVPCRVVVDAPTSFTVNGQPPNALRGSGLTALVRGMFVDVIIAAKPQSELLLVPRLAVKPGNIIWKFEPDPAALPPVVGSAEGEPRAETEQRAPRDPRKSAPLDPEQWQVGYLRVLTRINVVHTLEVPGSGEGNGTTNGAASSKYWICEVPSGALQAGDQVVVSPLSAIVGDGTDAIRVRKGQP
jgi:multidrug efflux pump subunit AcrA (membrane-fusion protein)